MTITLAITAVVALTAGYWAGRTRAGRRLLDWAYDQDNGPHGPAWWAAQSIGLVAFAWMLTTHPRRAVTNIRLVRAARHPERSPAVQIPRAPAPQLDPDWAAKRGATPRDEDQ